MRRRVAFYIITAIGLAGLISAYKKIDFEYSNANHYLTSSNQAQLDAVLNSSELWVSNRPESFSRPGILFEQVLSHSNSRLLYHHKNVSKTPYIMNIQLKNTGEKPVELTLISGVGGPSHDEIFSGHVATRRFWLGALTPTRAVEVVLQPGEIRSIVHQELGYAQVGSGIIEFIAKRYRDILVKGQIVDTKYPHLTGFEDITPDAFDARRYPKAVQTIRHQFKTTDKLSTIPIGDAPFLEDVKTKHPLKGNYGLMYKVSITVTNPSNSTAHVNLFLTPAGGNARANYILNGHLFETEMLKGNDTYVMSRKIYSTQLKPKTSDKIDCIIMPQAGSFYPLNLMLRSGNVHQPDQ